MKITKYQNEETLVIGGEQELKFSIEENGVIFDILRDKMYSNKIGSIVREVASNSRDANREVGNADLPINIMITNQYSETLIDQYCVVFQDSGPGISPQRMMDVFVKYAASTKRDTDSQTGGFGLGAKTPFAYTDSFYISTVAINEKKEKKHYFYNALIDDTGAGKMILLEESDSDNITGTDIIIPLTDANDRRDFANEIIYYTSLWGDKVKTMGVTGNSWDKFDKDSIIEEDENIIIIKESYSSPFRTGVYCLIDGIPYPIDNRISDKISDLSGGLESHTIFLKFNTGDIPVTATREGIEYNDVTNKAIEKAFDTLLTQAIRRFNKYLKTLTYLECVSGVISTFARQQSLFNDSTFEKSVEKLIIKLTYKYSKDSDILSKLKYNGTTLREIKSNQEHVDRFKLKNFEITRVFRHKPEEYSSLSSPNLLKIAKGPFYLLDSKKDRRRNHTIFDDITQDYFLLIRPFGGNIDSNLTESQYRFFVDMIYEYGIEPSFYGDVEKKEIPKTYDPNIWVPGETVSCRMRKFSDNYEEFGYSYIVEVNRETRDYKPFIKENDYIVEVDSISDKEINYTFKQLVLDFKGIIYLVSSRNKRLYLPDVESYKENELEPIIKELKEKKFQELCSGVDLDLITEGLTFIHNNYHYNRSSDVQIRDGWNTMNRCSFLALGIFDKNIERYCKTVLRVTPSLELIETLLSGNIADFSEYRDRFNIVKTEFKRGKTISLQVKLIKEAFKKSFLVKKVLSGYNSYSLEDMTQIVEELVTLKK